MLFSLFILVSSLKWGDHHALRTCVRSQCYLVWFSVSTSQQNPIFLASPELPKQRCYYEIFISSGVLFSFGSSQVSLPVSNIVKRLEITYILKFCLHVLKFPVGWGWWLTAIIPDTQEAESGGVKASPGRVKVRCSLKNKHNKKDWGCGSSTAEGLQFHFQCHNK
jgi:hypothetical protein